MIIIASKPGQLGNLLIVYASLMAYSREHGLSLKNPAFHQYNKYFKGTAGKRGSQWMYKVIYYFARLLSKTRISNGFAKCVYLDWHEQINLDERANQENLSAGFCFVQGWQFRCNQLLQKHRSFLIEYFSPAKKYTEQVNRFFTEHSQGKEPVIGIHIRRGDYIKFEGGKYFYDFKDYLALMAGLKKIPQLHNARFLICSNEEIPDPLFSGSGLNYFKGPGEAILDLYALAKCSYIAGPPSTFSMWASFYGAVPLLMIHDIKAPFTIDSFKIRAGF